MKEDTDPKTERAIRLLEEANKDFAPLDQVMEGFELLMEKIVEFKQESDKLHGGRDQKLSDISDSIQAQIKTVKDSFNKYATKEELGVHGTDFNQELARLSERISSIKIPEPTDIRHIETDIGFIYSEMEKFRSEIDSPEEIRDQLEKLQGEARLDASAIKNLPEMVESTTKTFAPVNHPLWALMDVAISGIIAGQSIQWDGLKWIPWTPPGSSGTPVWAERLDTQSPTGSVFNLAHTPILGSVRVFRGGAYQSVSEGDYTITGGQITLTSALQNGEALVSDYSW